MVQTDQDSHWPWPRITKQVGQPPRTCIGTNGVRVSIGMRLEPGLHGKVQSAGSVSACQLNWGVYRLEDPSLTI